MSMNQSFNANNVTIVFQVGLRPIIESVSAHRVPCLPAGGSRGEYGGAALLVIWLASPRRAAANRDGVNTAAVAVAGAVVAPSPSVP